MGVRQSSVFRSRGGALRGHLYNLMNQSEKTMSANKKINVALAGLGFGAEFVPIYLHHPNVESLTICDSDAEVLQ